MGAVLNPQVAARAVDLVVPSINNAVTTGLFKRPDMHIVVMNPVAKPKPNSDTAGTDFLTAILVERSLGDPAQWKHDFKDIARHKAKLSWLHGMSTRDIQTEAPYLLTIDDTIHYGSVVREGLVVACSGVQPYFDELVAGWVADACKALSVEARETGQIPNDGDFVNGFYTLSDR